MYIVSRKTLNDIAEEFIDSRDTKEEAQVLCAALSRHNDQWRKLRILTWLFTWRVGANTYSYALA